jgi:hypothetical protein
MMRRYDSRQLKLRGRHLEVTFTDHHTPGSRFEPAWIAREVTGLFMDGQRFDHHRHERMVDRILEYGK